MSMSYQEWYAKYGESHNRIRRERYASDPEYRETCKARTREYRVKRADDPEYMEKHRTRVRAYQRRVREQARLYRLQQEAGAIQ